MSGGPGLTRRVSRVESLRRLLLGASQQEARRLFDRRKQRYTVDKAIGEFKRFIHGVIHNNRLKVKGPYLVSCSLGFEAISHYTFGWL